MLGAKPNKCIIVGDSDVDAYTAQNADMEFVGVSWGYRSEAVLFEAGAKYVVEDTESLISTIEKIVRQNNAKKKGLIKHLDSVKQRKKAKKSEDEEKQEVFSDGEIIPFEIEELDDKDVKIAQEASYNESTQERKEEESLEEKLSTTRSTPIVATAKRNNPRKR